MTHLPRTTPSRLPRRLSALVTLAALLVTAVALGAGTAQAAASETGWIRVGHLSPGTPKADVRLTPFEGGETTTLTEASFGDLSTYERVPTGLYTVSLVEAGRPDADAMLSRNVEIGSGGASTVIATGRGDDVRATVLQDDLTPPAEGQAKVRLISAATATAPVDASVVDGPTLARDLRTGAATGYADVAAQTWQVELATADGSQRATSRVPVDAGGVYTLVALDTQSGGIELRAVQDSGSSTSPSGAMPSGGVDAGAGGNAAPAAPATSLALGGVAALSVLGAVGGAALLRRRGTQ